MIKDKYSRVARLYPSILTAIPFLVLLNDFISEQFKSTIDAALLLSASMHVIFSVAIIYLLTQLIRFVGKEIERIVFRSGLNFPTTLLLLADNNTLSIAYKERLYDRIYRDFNINVSRDAGESVDETKRRIRDAVGLIRGQVKDGRLLLQHNLEYGFFRNLFGGSIYASLVCLISLVIYRSESDRFQMYVIFFIVYIFAAFVCRYLLSRYSSSYAQQLFLEYLSSDEKNK